MPKRADEVGSRALFRTGIIGAVVAAACCATPILGVALGAIGLSALVAKADYVLIPILLASLGLVGIGLYRRNASALTTADCCATDKNAGKAKS